MYLETYIQLYTRGDTIIAHDHEGEHVEHYDNVPTSAQLNYYPSGTDKFSEGYKQ